MEIFNDPKASLSDSISFSRDFSDIEDVEGYLLQPDFFDVTNTKPKYFYRVGDTLNVNIVNCTYVDCDGAFFLKELISLAYHTRATHIEGSIPCLICRAEGRKGIYCEARFSIDIKYKDKRSIIKDEKTPEHPQYRANMY
jgi:hypothetical protein